MNETAFSIIAISYCIPYALIMFIVWCLYRIVVRAVKLVKGEEQEKTMPLEYWDAAGEYDEEDNI